MADPRALLTALAATGLLAAGCGGSGSEESIGEADEPTPIARVVEDEPGTEVSVEGRAYPYADLGYALTDGDAAVFVTALPTEVAKVQPGEVLRVEGRLQDIGPGLAESLADAQPGAGFDRARDPALASLSLEVGAPLVANPSATGEGNDTSPARDDAGSPD